MTDEDPAASTWRNYFGPIILTPRRRRFTGLLLLAWAAATAACIAWGRDDIVWLPIAGVITSSVLMLRDRAGRRRAA